MHTCSVARGVLGMALLSFWTAGSAAPRTVPPRTMAPAEIDRLVERTMAAYPVPGIAVGVVKDGKLVYAKGFGLRAFDQSKRVDADTMFGIGSNTKEFTAAALAILVDEGKLHWDDHVIDWLPEFRMHDAWVTREFTIRDLLTHRSGLGLGAGDLMFVTKTDFTRAEMIRALRHLKPVSSFRTEYAYDNLLYAVAGEVVAAASGKSWEAFITERILAPLGMGDCAAAPALLTSANRANPHIPVNGKLQKVPLLEISVVNAAGSIVCSVNGMARWMTTQLSEGAIPAPGTGRLYSAARAAEMWAPQTILPTGSPVQQMSRTHFAAYGLGWVLEDYQGYKRISHNGGLPGVVTHVSLLPELGLGVVVLTNQQEPVAIAAIPRQILDAYIGAPPRDWLATMQEQMNARTARLAAASAKRAPPRAAQPVDPATFAAYVGRYNDAWRGDATVTQEGEHLVLKFSRTEGLAGPLEAISPGLFIVRWNDRTLNADAYVRFTEDFEGKVTGLGMQSVSDATDFSFDFTDLDFRRMP